MAHDERPTVSRRNLVRALLGRDIPKPRADASAPDRHAAGDAAYAAGDYPAAVAAYRASVREDLSNTAVRFRLGHALYATGQALQARVEFEHVLRLSGGTDAAARFFLALSLLALHKPAKAALALAAFADPDRPELERAAHEAAQKLENDPTVDAAGMARELHVLAAATALVPESPTSA
ncbi:tetratricopeptide repeat protein [Solidesulfovibrio alcoholivorans]|uniref:tetratricopeptide repeat protein n=1 Tax=Solidesulfovibrio alcoholivorans TaxID=81406 RepID=UPI0004979663|nr:tetratricopeptide repeat protein [Solidesulfovibrio alcoholivorans]